MKGSWARGAAVGVASLALVLGPVAGASARPDRPDVTDPVGTGPVVSHGSTSVAPGVPWLPGSMAREMRRAQAPAGRYEALAVDLALAGRADALTLARGALRAARAVEDVADGVDVATVATLSDRVGDLTALLRDAAFDDVRVPTAPGAARVPDADQDAAALDPARDLVLAARIRDAAAGVYEASIQVEVAAQGERVEEPVGGVPGDLRAPADLAPVPRTDGDDEGPDDRAETAPASDVGPDTDDAATDTTGSTATPDDPSGEDAADPGTEAGTAEPSDLDALPSDLVAGLAELEGAVAAVTALLDGDLLDRARVPFLTPERARLLVLEQGLDADQVAAWSRWQNGRVPLDELCTVEFAPDALLRCDAAYALELLNEEYRAEFGEDMGVVSSYRSFEAQVRLKAAKGWLAATPGRSNHGWGVAVDLAGMGGLGEYGSPRYRWMLEHGPAYGWYHPRGMRPGGSGPPEPWHFEFGLSAGGEAGSVEGAAADPS